MVGINAQPDLLEMPGNERCVAAVIESSQIKVENTFAELCRTGAVSTEGSSVTNNDGSLSEDSGA